MEYFKMISILMLMLLLPGVVWAQLNVVATLPALAQIAQAVAGEEAQVVSLASLSLQQRMDQWKAQLPPSLTIVTYHDSYRYLVDAFGISAAILDA